MSPSRPALKSTRLPDASVMNNTMSPSQWSVSYCDANDGTRAGWPFGPQPIVTCVGPVFVVVATLVSVLVRVFLLVCVRTRVWFSASYDVVTVAWFRVATLPGLTLGRFSFWPMLPKPANVLTLAIWRPVASNVDACDEPTGHDVPL